MEARAALAIARDPAPGDALPLTRIETGSRSLGERAASG